jgi:dihydroflavonol-4-reductase
MTDTAMNSGDVVLVTGGTGFVGSAVLRALASRGVKLRALARAGSARSNLEGVDCEVAVGDMTDPAAMGAAMAGARFVFHVAADYRLWARDPGEIMRANVVGTRAVLAAARAAGVEKIVHTSSVATLNAGREAIDETAPLADGEGIGVYKRSKVAAERLVERMAAEGLPVTIVLPSTPIGPRDIKPTPTGRILIEAAAGRIPAFLDTGLNLVHVDDVAAGHLLALERGAPGERYILGGQDASLRRLLADIAALTGRRAPTLGLPRAPLYPLAYAAEAMARLTGREPMVTRDALDMAAHRMFFTSAKAERDLGYRARPYQEALGEALAWFRAAGYIA